MVYLYTEEQKQETLRSLSIKPIRGRVTGQEAARILSWRAKNEFGIDHQYNTATLRRHVEQGNLKAYPGTKLTSEGRSRKSLYDVDVIFELSIAPRRGAALKENAA